MKLPVPSYILLIVAGLVGTGCASSRGAAVLTIQPNSLTIAPGQMVPFSASLNNQPLSNANWWLTEGDSGGTLTAQGLYIAPTSSGTYHVNAKYRDVQATVNVTVRTGPIVPIDDGGTAANDDSGAVPGSHVTRDPNGWTVVTPSSDSRIIYVSSKDGDDGKGAFVLGSDIPPGQTAQARLPAAAFPFKTIAKAKSLLRPGYPDWLLLKAGDIWAEHIGSVSDAGGRSTSEPRVFSSYETGDRPQLQPSPADIAGTSGAGGVIYHTGSAVTSHVYFIGLEIYNAARDPSSPSFIHDASRKAAGLDFPAIGWYDNGDDVLFEDCFIHFCSMGAEITTNGSSSVATNFTIRRSIFADMYAINGHSQGMYTNRVSGAVIEENIFDHNAWNDDAGVPADIFNHHLYMANLAHSTVRNNVFLRAESLATKFISGALNGAVDVTIDNNFYFEGEVGISVGYQNAAGGADGTPSGGSVTNGLHITNNVLLQIDRDNPTGRGLGWGMDLKSVSNVELSGNIFSDFSATDSTYAINLQSADQTTCISSNVTIEGNTLYRIKNQGIRLFPQAGWSNVQIRNNAIQDGGLGAVMQSQSGTFLPLTYSGNVYSASNPARFALVNNVEQIRDQWIEASGETGSTVRTVPYPNPGLNLDTYMAKFSLKLADLYAAVRKQSKATWNPAYTATAINNYIRGEGFGFPTIPPSQ